MSELPTDLLRFFLDLGKPLPEVLVKSDIAELPAIPTSSPKPQKRCGACKHKLLLSDIACRCGIRHCATHRLPEAHACSYDHKREERKVLEAQVVACIADKMEDRI